MTVEREFPCKADRLSRLITAAALLGYPALLLFLAMSDDGSLGPESWIFLLIPLLLPYVMLFFSPRAVGADKDGIWIRRRAGLKKIVACEIVDVRLPESGEMHGVIRTFGNGGLFGYTGYYRNARVGSMRWYCTRRSNYVLVVRASGPVVVITPNDPEGFLEHYRLVTAA